jgi:phosphatidylinositol-3-phosphatase
MARHRHKLMARHHHKRVRPQGRLLAGLVAGLVIGSSSAAAFAASSSSPTDRAGADLATIIAAAQDAQAALASQGVASPSPSTSASPTTSVSPSPTTDGAPFATSSATASGPRVTKLLTIMEENHSTAQMEAGMPYLVSLGAQYGRATGYQAISHPSLPNYLAIAGGSTFGVTDDNDPSSHKISGQSIFGQATAAGLTAGSYNESMSANCTMTGNTDFGYAVKHNPQAYFVDEHTACAATDKTSAGFLADAAANRLPNVAMLTPNKGDDAHDGTLAQADAYLKANLPTVLGSSDFTSGRLAVVITADEDDNSGGTNGVFTVVLQAGLHGVTVSAPLTHYSLTRLYAEVIGTTPLRSGATAPDMAAAFGLKVGPAPVTSPSPTTSPTPSLTPTTTPSPSPTSSGTATAGFTWAAPAEVSPTTVHLTDQVGSLVLDTSKDYVLACPASGIWHNAKGFDVTGGRTVIFENCTVDVGAGNAGARRGGYLKVGTHLFMQNVTFEASGSSLTEGLDLAGDTNTDTLQGITFLGGLQGSYATNHADCVQSWAGPSVLQVDGLTCTSGYQGMFLLPDQHSSIVVSNWDLRNVSITAQGYALWRDGGSYAIHTTNFNVSGTTKLWPNAAAWPNVVLH